MGTEETKVLERYEFWKPFLAEEPQEDKESWEDLKKGSVDCCGCDGCGPACSA